MHCLVGFCESARSSKISGFTETNLTDVSIWQVIYQYGYFVL